VSLDIVRFDIVVAENCYSFADVMVKTFDNTFVVAVAVD
jgi:hypothetical protein